MKRILAQLSRRDVHPTVQFVKYALAGGVATAVDMGVFFIFAATLFPALTDGELLVRLLHLDVPFIEESIRGRNFIINNVIAFFCSNLVAYVINMLWVFQPGRHKRHVELLLFYSVSTFSIVMGVFLGWSMIYFLGATTSFSYIGKVVASVMINYVCRKYIVFKG